MIGIERERRGKAAGYRTNIWVAAASGCYRFAFTGGDGVRLQLTYCETHPAHRRFVAEVLEVPGVARQGS